MSDPILCVRHLRVVFDTTAIVRGIDFEVQAGKNLAVVGESGSGKSQTFLSIMRLSKAQVSGEVIFKDQPLLDLDQKTLNSIRGRDMAMIFQDPHDALNPFLTIGMQLGEVLKKHLKLSKKEARTQALHLLEKVGISDPKKRLESYAHQLSGGMCQRVMIAMALLCNPSILIADEPTTALDVTIQAQILELFDRLKEEFDMALVLITHDLNLVAGLCDEIMVMYAGKIVEKTSVKNLFDHPKHPYTLGLLSSNPHVERLQSQLQSIGGTPPNLQDLPKGCAFAPRCPFKIQTCEDQEPALKSVGNNHYTACFVEDISQDKASGFFKNKGDHAS